MAGQAEERGKGRVSFRHQVDAEKSARAFDIMIRIENTKNTNQLYTHTPFYPPVIDSFNFTMSIKYSITGPSVCISPIYLHKLF